MKVLYGVQGTGNGHLSRARAMAKALGASELDVDFLFSGRSANRFFDMAPFGVFRVLPGLTFVSVDGEISFLRTLTGNSYWQLIRDVACLELDGYDLILTDFEPITAWAGRLRRKKVISLGHQPAFDHAVPLAGRDWRSALVMRFFAPGHVRVGMHWGKFGAPILPPIVDLESCAGTARTRAGKVLVYLPFENQDLVRAMLRAIPDYDFYIYAPANAQLDEGNLHCRPTSLEGFRADLGDCSAVICNAGFELSSECLALGKRLLVKPLSGQMEQASNAFALRELDYAHTLDALDAPGIRSWLEGARTAPRIHYPDVAAAITRWLEAGDFHAASLGALSDRLWREVIVNQ